VSEVVHALLPAHAQLQADELHRPGELPPPLLRGLHDPLLLPTTVTIAVANACTRIAPRKGFDPHAWPILRLLFSVISLIVLLVPSTKMRERQAASDETRLAGPDFDDDLRLAERWRDEVEGASQTVVCSTIGTVWPAGKPPPLTRAI
jgi:hypothetical protein